jgi:hypothetical protein
MDTGAPATAAMTDLPRAGFWRRWLATLIDSIIVMLPFQVLAAVLFAMTAGAIQMNSGFASICAPTKTISPSLDPPPPHDSNFARLCKTSFLGATTAATLTVGRTTREGSVTRTVSRAYMLDRDGNPIHGTSIDWAFWPAFLAYLTGMIWKSGKTLGARVAGVRVVDIAQPAAPGVALRKTIIRYLAMGIGAVPALAVLIYPRIAVGGDADAMFTAGFFEWYAYAAGFGALWVIFLVVQIAMKKDPVYDRLAGTAVLKSAGIEPTAP